jgi:hypothetical protein
MENKAILSIMIFNICLLFLVGWCVWYLKSPIPFFGLMFLYKYKRKIPAD